MINDSFQMIVVFDDLYRFSWSIESIDSYDGLIRCDRMSLPNIVTKKNELKIQMK